VKKPSAWWVRALHPVLKRTVSERGWYRWCAWRFRHEDRRKPKFEHRPVESTAEWRARMRDQQISRRCEEKCRLCDAWYDPQDNEVCPSRLVSGGHHETRPARPDPSRPHWAMNAVLISVGTAGLLWQTVHPVHPEAATLFAALISFPWVLTRHGSSSGGTDDTGPY
jgi:hypothetical protein